MCQARTPHPQVEELLHKNPKAFAALVVRALRLAGHPVGGMSSTEGLKWAMSHMRFLRVVASRYVDYFGNRGVDAQVRKLFVNK